MAIFDRLKRFWRGSSEPQTTTFELLPQPSDSDWHDEGWFTEHDYNRYDTVTVCREMAQTDPRVDGALDTLARDVVMDGVTVTVDKATPRAAAVQAVVDALLVRLPLEKMLKPWVKAAARDGDVIIEIGVNSQLEIAKLTRKPPLQIERLSDEFDRFINPAEAFLWDDLMNRPAWGFETERSVKFPEFLIVHARWDHNSENRYGTPMFASAINAWNRVKQGEQDIAIRRRTRAGIKYQHLLVGATNDDIEAYIERNRRYLAKPFSASADFFMGGEAGSGVSAIGGDSGLGDIRDIEHHIQTMFAASPVPLELLGYGANLNRDVLDDKRKQYDRTLMQIREWVADEIIRPILNRQLLLAGFLPEDIDLHIGWSSNKVVAPADIIALVQAVQAMTQLRWEQEAIFNLVRPHLPSDIDMEELFQPPPSILTSGEGAIPAEIAGQLPPGSINALLAMKANMAAQPNPPNAIGQPGQPQGEPEQQRQQEQFYAEVTRAVDELVRLVEVAVVEDKDAR